MRPIPRKCAWLFVLVLLQGTLLSAGYGGIVGINRLTWSHQPGEWELFAITPNPFAPYYQTELSVPETARLSVEVFATGHESESRSLVRRIVSPEDGWFVPAVYAVDWWCLCDSLDLPVTGTGRYLLVVQGFAKADPTRSLYRDSIDIVAFERPWDVLTFESDDFQLTVLRNWVIYNDDSIVPTTVINQYPEFAVEGVRLRRGSDSAEADRLVIKLENVKEIAYDPFRQDARGYRCVRDSSTPCGYRIQSRLEPFRSMHAVWELNLEDRVLLMVDCTSHWPLVVDASAFLDKLRSTGVLK